ncbi:MBL fold metallo-hydrolase [Desulfovibrio cuneatus]|uniref:MBL fold metallo-hydrolase n=1 Tax=Desulfovibrio cuneatus TaxID=159728 RepID=UPI0004107309|nr:MBL fold metallo-hydrolase [Desulfovibrio cuneatus]
MLCIHTLPLGPLQTNCYVAHNASSAVVVDPGGDPAPVLALLEQQGVKLTHVLLTHLHFDHTYGVAKLVEATGAACYANADDNYLLGLEIGAGGAWGFPKVPAYQPKALAEGSLELCGETCQIIATPGHTPGGLCFYFPKSSVVFVGDTLFERSVGRTDLEGGNTETLLESIRTKLFTLPENTTAYPGHGDSTTIGDEVRNNPYVSDFA